MKNDNLTKRQLNQIGFKVIEAAIKVHKALGTGLLESVYETCLIHELKSQGFKLKSQVVVPVIYKGIKLNNFLFILPFYLRIF